MSARKLVVPKADTNFDCLPWDEPQGVRLPGAEVGEQRHVIGATVGGDVFALRFVFKGSPRRLWPISESNCV